MRIYLEAAATLYDSHKMICAESENDPEHYELYFSLHGSVFPLLVKVPKKIYVRSVLPKLLKEGYFHVSGLFEYHFNDMDVTSYLEQFFE